VAEKTASAVYVELTSKPPAGDALAVITPPQRGYMRVHISLSNLSSSELAFAIDVYPPSGELGDVKVKV